MMLAGLPVADGAVDGLAELVRAIGGEDLADRLERAPSPTRWSSSPSPIDERAITLDQLEDPPGRARGVGAVLLDAHQLSKVLVPTAVTKC